MPENLGLQLESEALQAFCGSGELRNGSSLKSKPYAHIFPEAGALWSPAESVLSGNSLLFGFKAGNFTFIAKGEEGKPAEPADGEPGPAIEADPGSAFRLAGFEYTGRSGAALASFSGYIAELPRVSSGGGWRPCADQKTEGTIFGLAAASEARGGAFGFGIWAAACAGYREAPGWACSAELGVPGNLKEGGTLQKNSSLAAKTYLLMRRAPGTDLRQGKFPCMTFWPIYRRQLRFRALAVSARAAFYSLSRAKGASDATRLLRDEAKPLEKLLWIWRNDFLKAGMDIAFSRCALAVRVSLDGAGVKEGLDCATE